MFDQCFDNLTLIQAVVCRACLTPIFGDLRVAPELKLIADRRRHVVVGPTRPQ